MSFLRREQPIPKEALEQSYVQEKRSMQEIADELGCSVHKVQYWMDKYEIQRRGWDEASYVKQNLNGDPFEIKVPTSVAERELFTLGVALYIGEGTKRNYDVRLANSDPLVIQAFLRFLRETCSVQENKIKAWLNIFDDADVERALNYWQDVTGLPRAQFMKTIVRPSRSGNYLNKSGYGTLTVVVSNKKLGDMVKQWCKELLVRQS